MDQCSPNFFFKAGGAVIDNAVYCLSISLSIPEIFALKVESCWEGKAQKVTQALYFTYLWGSPLRTDFHQILHIVRYARVNHLCKFWCQKIEGFGIYKGSNFRVFHWNGWSPLQQSCATAQPVIRAYLLNMINNAERPRFMYSFGKSTTPKIKHETFAKTFLKMYSV